LPVISRASLIGLVSCTGLSLLLLAIIAVQDGDLVFERGHFHGRLETPFLRIHSKRPCAARVLLIHGLAASKSALTQMGVELARLGLDCFLVDLPGHGASAEVFSRAAALQAVDEIVDHLLITSDQSREKSVAPLIVIGHSFGAGLAITAARQKPPLGGAVAISPAVVPINPREPEQLLILLGEFDFPFVRRGAAFLYEAGTGIRLPDLEGPMSWENPEKTRRLVVLPWCDHSQGIFRPKSFQEIRGWIDRLFPETRLKVLDSAKSRTRLGFRAFLCVSLLLLWMSLAAVLGDLLGVREGQKFSLSRLGRRFRELCSGLIPPYSPPLPRGDVTDPSLLGMGERPAVALRARRARRASRRTTWYVEKHNAPYIGYQGPQPLPSWGEQRNLSLLSIYALAGMVAVITLTVFNPWQHLRLMGGSYLGGFLFITGVLGCFVTRPTWHKARFNWRILAYALLAALILACLMAPFISRHFVYLNLSLNRMWRIPWLIASVLPFYVFDEWAWRYRLQGTGRLRLVLLFLSTRLAMAMLLLLGFFVLRNSQFLVVLILPGLLLLSVLCWCLASWIFQRSCSPAASALFSALTTAWFLSVFFTQT
jgi:pimeloyl-ACP methyl ester carboxylesterase